VTRVLAYGLFSVYRVDTHVKARGILPYELDWFVLRPAKSLNLTPFPYVNNVLYLRP